MRAYAFLVAGLAAIVSAQGTDNPTKTPALGEVVVAGKNFAITWDPTTPTDDTITIELCKGPSTNCVKQFAIATGIKNSGSFSWAVPTTLEPSTTSGAGYGIKLVVEKTGNYQFTPQFGISNPSFSSSSSTSASGTVSSTRRSSTATATQTTSGSSSPSPSVTGTGNTSVPTLTPTNSMSVPSTLRTTTGTQTTSGVPQQTNAAAAAGIPKAFVGAVAIGLGALVL